MNTFSSNNSKTVIGRVLHSASVNPQRPALELHDKTYSYQDLTESAAAIAHSIIKLDDPNPYVAVVADKSFSCYAGILGILLSGKAYMPINPRFPETRNQYMLEKAGVKTTIEDGIAMQLPSSQSPLLEHKIREQDMDEFNTPHAYLLFTSGTTGNPKGVPVSQANLASYLDFMLKTYDFRPDDRFTQIFDLTFDLSIHDIFLAWSVGACLCVPEDNSSFAMAGFIREKQPTLWFSVPSAASLMDKMRLLKPDAFPSIRLSFFCGEALPARLAQSWQKAAPRSRLINLYGPTEATIAISRYELPEDPASIKSEIGIVSIGKVFDGNLAGFEKEFSRVTCDLNCDTRARELLLSGPQVVDGYFENPEADQQAFLTDTNSGIKWYRTGDLVKADKDGNLFFMGRKDTEVKISGYRVNLKEIENVLQEYETVSQAVVTYKQQSESTGVIVAFILEGNRHGDEFKIDKYCRKRLPWYMIPGKYIFVKDIPRNPNGKVDMAALLKYYYNGK
jgi:amino acid adenylation domain-containing protein